jgi:hypothetical protein
VRWSVSIKSNKHLTQNGFDSEFVQDAWADWKSGKEKFDPSTDLLGLATGSVAEGNLELWNKLRAEAADTTPDRFLLRIDGKGQLSGKKKALFESLCSQGTGCPSREEAARLAGRIQLLYFNETRDEGRLVSKCALLTRSGKISDGTTLWRTLCQLAADSRGTGAAFDLAKLLRHLRPTCNLKDHPDFQKDWSVLDSITELNFASIRSVLGDGLVLNREIEVNSINAQLKNVNVLALVG